MVRLATRRWSLLAGLVVSACAKASAPPTSPSAPEGSAVTKPGEVEWVFHPAKKAPTTARVKLEDGRILFLDEAGSRWLLRSQTDTPEPAPFGAEEPLVDVGRDGKDFAFVGKQGGIFLSKEVLDPFYRVRRPPQEVVTASLAQDVVLATTKKGTLLRTENWGRSWQERTLDGFVMASAMDEDGTALAVTLPEQWNKSEDGGRTWSTLDELSVGPLSLFTAPDGTIITETLRGILAFDGEHFIAARGRKRQKARWTMPPFANAESVRAGAADLSDGYWSLPIEHKRKKALVGNLGEPLSSHQVSGLKNCGPHRVARRGRHVVVACILSGSGTSPKIGVFRSEDGGKRFERVAVSLRGQLPRLVLALSEQSTLAMSGLCPPELSQAGCDPYGVYVLAANERKPRHLGLPGLPVTSALAFTKDERLWALGRRQKDGHALLFSADVFTGEKDKASSQPRALSVDGMIDLHQRSRFPRVGKEATLQLLPGDDGYLTALIEQKGAYFSALVSSQGEVLAAGTLPAGATAAHGAGRKLLALDASTDRLWESVDGGLSWSQGSLPRPACPHDEKDCSIHLACSDEGCLVGSDLTRLGWGAQLDGEVHDQEQPKWSPQQFEKGVAYVCRPSERPWRPLGAIKGVPDIRVAALGKTAWSQVRGDRETGAVDALHASWKKDEISEKRLLGPVSSLRSHALWVSEQVEGSAAIRYRIPRRSQGRRMISGVEVAWDNRITDVIGYGKLDGEHAPLPGDHETRARGIHLARPGLLSVAGQGVYLRLHHASTASQETYFFEGNDVQQVETAMWPGEWKQKGHREMVKVGAMHSPLLFFNDRRLVVRAMARPAGGYRMVPHLLGLPHAAQREIGQAISIGYLGQRVGFVSMQVSPDGKRHSARMTMLGTSRPFEPPIDVPLNIDLEPSPKPCSEKQRRTTPRIVAPAFPARVHEVIVEEPGQESLELETSRSVVFGTPEDPCLAAYEAHPPSRKTRPNDFHRALLFFDSEGTFGWLFRVDTDPVGATTVSARPLTCRQ